MLQCTEHNIPWPSKFPDGPSVRVAKARVGVRGQSPALPVRPVSRWTMPIFAYGMRRSIRAPDGAVG